MKGPYDDIIHLPYQGSAVRPHMSARDRAAQFAPFAALTGYEDAVREAARLTDTRAELTEDEQSLLDGKLQKLADCAGSHPKIELTWFQADRKKAGGAYVTTSCRLKKIDDYEGALVLMEGERILIEDLLDVRLLEPSPPSDRV